MTKPVVYLRSECFLSILFAAIDTGKRECLGILFGREDNRSGSKLIIDNVCEIQSVKRRSNCGVEQSRLSNERMNKLIKCAPKAFNFLGNFHSHPQWGDKGKHYPLLSDPDFESLRQSGAKLEIIVDIGRAKGSCPWMLRQSGAIVGRLANWRFALHAYGLIGEGEALTWQKLKIKVDPSVFLKLR